MTSTSIRQRISKISISLLALIFTLLKLILMIVRYFLFYIFVHVTLAEDRVAPSLVPVGTESFNYGTIFLTLNKGNVLYIMYFI